jgi:non-specific serine/threonine protein kinase
LPIDIDLFTADRLKVTICDADAESQVSTVLAGLLTSQFIRSQNFWTVSFHDFQQLKFKLEQLGLVEGRTATAEAIAWLTEKQAEHDSIERLKRGVDAFDVRGLDALKTALYEDQVAGIRFLLTRQRAVLADEMGVGKSFQLLSTFLALREQDDRLLVLCPNSVKTGWVKEICKHTDLTVIAVGNGTKQVLDDLAFFLRDPADVLVAHYDALVRPAKNGEATQPWSKFCELLMKMPWAAVVLDEAHQVKTMDSRRTQSALLLTQSAANARREKSRIYMATGTPVSESPLDAWSVLSFLDPSALPRSYSKFENYFTTKATHFGHTKTWRQTVGYKNLSELKNILHHVMIRRLKVDIKGMPDRVEQTRYITMGEHQRRLYDDIKAGIYDAIEREPDKKLSIVNAMAKCLRLRQVLNHPRLVEKDGIPSAKYAALDEILEEVMADPLAKVVIWTEWREAVELLSSRYAQKYGTITLIGGTTQAELSRYSMHWDTMPERIAVCTPAFGGTGIDFLQRCRTAIYVEPPYSTILFRQSMDRIHRRATAGTSDLDRIKASPATLIFLQVEKSIDQLVYNLLARKGNLVDALLVENEKLIELGREELLQHLR